MYTGIWLLLLMHPFIFSFQFSNIKIFITLFSGTARPRRLKFGTHMDNGWMYRVYRKLLLIHLFIFAFFFLSRPRTWYTRGQWVDVWCIPYSAVAAYLFPISLVFFLSNFQTLKIFIALFSETEAYIKLKLDSHVDNGWMYHVYRNQAAASYLSLISSFFFLKFSKIKKFCHTFLRNCGA